jgi:hypothetical protein
MKLGHAAFFSKEEEQLVKENFGKLKRAEIAALLGRNEKAISKVTLRLGLREKGKSPNPPTWTEEEETILVKNYGKLKYREIEKLLPNKELWQVIRKCKVLGIVDREKTRHLQANTIKKTSCFETYFEIPTLENSYWAGFLAADGNIAKDLFKIGLQLSQKDVEHCRKLYETLESDSKFTEYTRKNGIKMCSFAVSSRKMVQDLITNFNITPQKTFTLKFPEHLSKENKLAFLVGYIDGDGSISIRKKWGYRIIQFTGNYGFLEESRKFLVDFFGELGYKNTTLQKGKERGWGTLAIQGKDRVSFLYQEVQKLNLPKLTRKWDKMKENYVWE